MDLQQIETFVRVAEHGSFSRAAGVMRIAQPALSRQVRLLETELRQRLFDRNGRGVTLTDAGRRFYAHGVGILQQVERARRELEDDRGAPVGRLALGLPPSLSRTLTVPLVRAFRERFPRAALAVVEGLSTYMLEWLVQGRIDAAVVYQVAPMAAVDLEPLMEEPLVLVSSPPERAAARKARPVVDSAVHEGPAIGLDELAAWPLVMPSRPHSIRMAVESAMAEARLKPRIELEVESVPAMLALVAEGPLGAVLSRQALRDLPPPLRLMARPLRHGVQGAALTTRLWMATSSQRPGSPLQTQGLALVREQLARF